MIRCAVYVRKSREDDTRDAHRLQLQRERLPEHARLQGWLPESYDDGYASAARGCVLPQRDRLEADLRAGRVQVVLAIELSRLSRDDTLQDYVRFLALCAEHGARLATPSRVLDPSQSSDWMLLLLEGGFSSVEMRQMGLRLKEGRERAYEAGVHRGGAIAEPYRRGSRPGQLVIDPEARQRVLAVLGAFVARGPVAAATLARGFGYHQNTLRRWISPAGLDWLLARRPSRERPGEWVRCTWEAVLTEAEAAEIAAARDATRHRTHAGRTPSLLSGLRLLRCGYCGSLVTGQSGADGPGKPKRHYYLCQKGGWTSACPKSRHLRRDAVDHAVVTHVLHTLARPELLAEAWHQADDTHVHEQAALRRAEEEHLRRKARLVEAVASGILPLPDVRGPLAEIEHDLGATRRALASLPAAPAEPEWADLAELAEAWEALERPERRRLLCACLQRIDLYHHGAVLTYAFPRGPGQSTAARVRFTKPRRQRSQKPHSLVQIQGGKS